VVGAIEVDPDEVMAVGNAIAGVAEGVAQIGAPLGGLGGCGWRPPLTAAALASLATGWPAGAERLGGELRSLGQTAQAAGFLYRRTDDSVIPVSPP
jgi:hypothetical protein